MGPWATKGIMQPDQTTKLRTIDLKNASPQKACKLQAGLLRMQTETNGNIDYRPGLDHWSLENLPVASETPKQPL